MVETATSRMGAGRLVKEEGSFYTPLPVAEFIVELAGLRHFQPHMSVIDPAAGDGALLVPAVRALCAALLDGCGLDEAGVASCVTSSVHAIELDAGEARACRENLSQALAEETGEMVDPSEWDVVAGDTCIEWKRYEGQMDAVIMNPPYVRIHNLAEKPDSPYVTGMCDLYYAFFDYAQRMLRRPDGVLVAIAPSSWMTSRAGAAMRDDIRSRGVLRSVCDYGHHQVFAPYALTYTAIVEIGATDDGRGLIRSFGHDGKGRGDGSEDLGASSCWHGGMFMPGAPDAMDEILSTAPGTGGVSVSTGYQTSADGLYVSRERRFSAYEIPVVKASTGAAMWGAYPYEADGSVASLSDIEAADASLADLLHDNEERLRKRNHVPSERWWAYGRTQGVADTYRDKVTTQLLFLPPTPPRTVAAPAGTGVVGGAYITGMTKAEVDEAFASDDFMAYVRALRKYKSDGYYAVSGRDLERFLGWWKETRR